MKLFLSFIFIFSSLNVFSCDDLDLRDRSIKVDIYYQYAPFANLEVAKDLVLYSSSKPGRLNISFKDDTYKIKVVFDIKRSIVNSDEKLLDLHFKSEDSKLETSYETDKVVKIKNSSKKISFYDWSRGKKMKFIFKEISLEEWSQMGCPNQSKEEEKVLHI